MKNFLNYTLFILAIVGIISVYLIGINNSKENVKKVDTSCLENILDNYLVKEDINPYEISLNNIIDNDLENVSYSKVVVNELKDIYVIIKTSDDSIIEAIDTYFLDNYTDYLKKELEGFTIYINNQELLDLSSCVK